MVSVSPLFTEVLSGKLEFKFEEPYYVTQQSVALDILYILDDGIYPS